MAKGVSHEEKKKRALEYLQQTKSVYSLKQLEATLPKAKGIISQSVKDVIIELVSDGKVDTDKIGSGVYFWAFPSKAARKMQNQLDKMSAALPALEQQREQLTSRKRALEADRVPSDERTTKLARLREVQKALTAAEVELGHLAAFDPDKTAKLQQGVKVCRDAANRWTDNIWTLQSVFKANNPSMTDRDFYQHFGLPLDLDYVT